MAAIKNYSKAIVILAASIAFGQNDRADWTSSSAGFGAGADGAEEVLSLPGEAAAGEMTLQNDRIASGFFFNPAANNIVQNDSPAVVVSPITVEQSGAVTIAYQISDNQGDSVSLIPEYSTDGISWSAATVTGALSQIPVSGYAGTLSWASKSDQPNRDLTVYFRLTPFDSDTGLPVSINFHVDNNQAQAVTLTYPVGSQSGSVPIKYTVTDATNDSVTLVCFYTTGSTWRAATVDVGRIGPGKYSDTLHWNSSIDIGNANANAVRFSIRANDGWAEGPADTTSLFAVANANRPIVSIATLSGEKSDKVTINYTLSDADNDTLSIAVEYSANGTLWLPATVSGKKDTLAPAAYAGSFEWLSKTDQPGADISSLMLRIVPSDQGAGTPDTVTFHLDNNGAPSVALTDPAREVSGDVSISYTLLDPEKDMLSVAGYFSLNGTTWKKATLTGNFSAIRDSGYAGAVVWKSNIDSVSIDVAALQFRLFVMDNDTGGADTTIFHIDNFHGQSLTLTTPTDTLSGNVDFLYAVTDATHDSITLVASYTVDAGSSWLPATLVGPSKIDTSKYFSTATWASGQDLGNINNAGVLFRLVPNDGWADGKGDTSAPFLLVNQGLPSSIVSPLVGEKSDSVTINYTLSDEDGDVLYIVPQYSLDGATWKNATVKGAVTNRDSSNYQGSVQWASKTDLPGKDVAALQFRVVPVDVDSGASTPAVFHLDNNAPPAVDVTVTASEKSDTVPVNILVTDSERDSVHAMVQYSINGTSWAPATLAVVQTALDSAHYQNVFQWLSRADLPNVDADSVRLRVFPVDNDTGKGDTVVINLDNNQQQSVLATVTSGTKSGDVTIGYLVSDPTGDTISVRADYSKDGGNLWLPAKLAAPVKVGPAGYQGTLIWNSAIDVGNINHPGIKIRLTPNDGWADGAAGTTAAFALSNQGFPTVTLLPLSAEQSDTVMGTFTLGDADFDTLSIAAQYSVDGALWKKATVAGKTTGFDSSQYKNATIKWASAVDLPGKDLDSVQFRIIPVDQDSGGASKIVFHLDNNAAPVCSLPPIPGDKTDSITVAFRLTDKEKDTLKIIAQYYLSSASAWLPATLAALPSLKDSSKYIGTLVWRSAADLPNAAGQAIKFRVIPMDRDTGKPGEITINVRQNFAPVCSTVAVTGVRSDTINIGYVLSDRENDSIAIAAQYYDSAQVKWVAAAVLGNTSGLDVAQYAGTIRWLSKQDRPNANGGPVRFRIVPSDFSSGAASEISILVQNAALALSIGGKLLGAQDPLALKPIFIVLRHKLDTASLDSTVVHLVGTQSDTVPASLSFTVFNDSTRLTLTPDFPNLYPFGGETLSIVVDAGLQDTAGKFYQGTSFKVPIANLGDFNLDGKINLSDLSYVGAFWHKSAVDSVDSIKDIGPVGGAAAPNYYPMPDGKFDYLDLGTFVDLWRWAKTHGLGRALAKPVVSNDLVLVVSKTLPDGRLALFVSARGVQRLSALSYRLDYDTTAWFQEGLEQTGLHVMTDRDGEGVDFNFVRLSSAQPFVSGDGPLPKIILRPLRPGAPFNFRYELVDIDHRLVAAGSFNQPGSSTGSAEDRALKKSVEGLVAYPVPAYRGRDLLSFRFSPGRFTQAKLNVFDLYGNLVWSQASTVTPGGPFDIGPFDLNNLAGRALAPGGYIAKVLLSGPSVHPKVIETRFAVR